MKKFYFFMGTTAELIKLSPVIAEFEKRKLNFKVISSNQNELRFSEVNHLIKKDSADYILKIKPLKWPKNIYARFIIWFLRTAINYFLYFQKELGNIKVNKKTYFIIHGDTVSSLLGALVAKLSGVKLIHIESGLRSFDFLEPFPEELNRYLISRLADYHFCPNKWALKNLKAVGGKKINTLSNTVVESTLKTLSTSDTPAISELRGKKYFVLVVHRQEHTLFNKSKSLEIINALVNKANKDLKCVFIMHKLTKDFLNKQKAFSTLKKNSNVILPDRLSYKKFVNLIANSEFVATDGGSNQEECSVLGKPCLILRKKTERIEGLDKNALLSKNNLIDIEDFVDNYKKYKRKKVQLKKQAPSKIIADYLSL